MIKPAHLLRSISSVIALLCGVSSISSCFSSSSYDEPRSYYSAVSLLNTTREAHDLSIYELNEPWLSLPCTTIEQSPRALERYLSNPETTLFKSTPSTTLTLHAGQEVPLDINKLNASPYDYFYGDYYYENNENGDGYGPSDNTNGLCKVLLIKSPALGQALIYWPRPMPSKRFYFDVEVPQEIPPDTQTITIKADYSKVPEGEPRHKWRAFDCGHWRAPTCEPQTIIEAKQRPRGATYTLESVYDIPLALPIPLKATDDPVAQRPAQEDALLWPPIAAQLTEIISLEEQTTTQQLSCAAIKLQQGQRSASTGRLCMPPHLVEQLTPSPDRRVFYKRATTAQELQLIHTTPSKALLGRWMVTGSELITIPNQNIKQALPDGTASLRVNSDLNNASLERLRCGDLYMSQSLLVTAAAGAPQLLTYDAPITMPDKTQLHLLFARRMLAQTNRCDIFDQRNHIELKLITVRPL